MIIQVVPYDPGWPAAFDEEAHRIEAALGDVPIRSHHIGSTAVPGLHAKPVIDILMEVPSLEQLDSRAPALAAMGYEPKGEFGIPGRRYFRRDNADGIRTHQVHAFGVSTDHVFRHLAFRDYMRAHPSVAKVYGELKARLALEFPDDLDAYMDGKDAFIKDHERKALLWRSP
jgi:GrpB-like predicted nucleotidyltransferase (UPF0157 family)